MPQTRRLAATPAPRSADAGRHGQLILERSRPLTGSPRSLGPALIVLAIVGCRNARRRRALLSLGTRPDDGADRLRAGAPGGGIGQPRRRCPRCSRRSRSGGSAAERHASRASSCPSGSRTRRTSTPDAGVRPLRPEHLPSAGAASSRASGSTTWSSSEGWIAGRRRHPGSGGVEGDPRPPKQVRRLLLGGRRGRDPVNPSISPALAGDGQTSPTMGLDLRLFAAFDDGSLTSTGRARAPQAHGRGRTPR